MPNKALSNTTPLEMWLINKHVVYHYVRAEFLRAMDGGFY